MSQRTQEVMQALDILPEDLTQEQHDKLSLLAEEVKDPNEMTADEAVHIVEELGIDIEAIQKKNGKPRESRKPKVGVNEPCPCGSGKKFKKCCRFKAQ